MTEQGFKTEILKGVLILKLKIGQTWISENHPHESFKIYDGVIDNNCDSIKDYTLPFDLQPEGSKVFFWERINKMDFMKFVIEKKGENATNTYPYALAGESKKNTVINKIKKYDMKLLNN